MDILSDKSISFQVCKYEKNFYRVLDDHYFIGIARNGHTRRDFKETANILNNILPKSTYCNILKKHNARSYKGFYFFENKQDAEKVLGILQPYIMALKLTKGE